ncbi:MAG: sensor histidine kinase [Pseudomonadota bacterium]
MHAEPARSLAARVWQRWRCAFAPAGAERIDWSQLWYPGPTRVFTPAELARAGGDLPSRTFLVMLAITAAILSQAVLQEAPGAELARLTAMLIAMCIGGYRGGVWLWREPTRKRLFRLSMVVGLLYTAFAFGLVWRMPPGSARSWVFGTLTAGFWLCTVGFWFVAVYRAHQIEARLRELDERDRAIDLARQLATAQIQPHFLFNSLASLQHWVDTRDDRAGPMLASLTGYLRATLPLFERRSLTLGEELEAARRYLEVMQARLGERLRFSIEVDEPVLLQAALPPGVLLTLVENAVEHGVAPRLSGGVVQLRLHRAGPGVQVEVADDGPGLAQGSIEPAPGHVGLANTRARLAQAFGERARLVLANAPEGGCVARLELPMANPGSTT